MLGTIPTAEYKALRVKEQLINRDLFSIVIVSVGKDARGISFKIPRAEGVSIAATLERPNMHRPQLLVVEYYGRLRVAAVIKVIVDPTKEELSHPMQWIHANVTNNAYSEFVAIQQQTLGDLIDG